MRRVLRLLRVGVALAAGALAAGAPARAQVNTERMRTTLDTTGVMAQLDAGLAYATGNTNFLLASIGGRADLVTGRFEAFVVGKTSLSQADGVVYVNQSFVHARVTEELGGPFAAEAFAQAEQNAQRLLQERYLAGAGLRLSLLDTGDARLAAGATPMAEFERLSAETGEPAALRMRLSHYLALRLQLTPQTAVSTIVYAQPALAGWDDLRVLGDFALDVELVRGVVFRTAANLRYDSQPPAGIATTDFEIRNGLVLALSR